mmetsp:Transcript_104729/g.265947  ORF Transcript_104729/g.265947 Transcript_104729/m.265947 type:complete len:202 (-) Transcript_104729:579-1184(-)
MCTSGTSLSYFRACVQSSTAPSRSSTSAFATALLHQIRQRFSSNSMAFVKSSIAPSKSLSPSLASPLATQSHGGSWWPSESSMTLVVSRSAPSKSCVCNLTLPRLRQARTTVASSLSASLQPCSAPSRSFFSTFSEPLIAALPALSSSRNAGACLAKPYDALGLTASCARIALSPARRIRRNISYSEGFAIRKLSSRSWSV